MRIAYFTHSLVSDWNHGNAHFLRGIVSELKARGHEVAVWEPQGNWSLQNLKEEVSQKKALLEFRDTYPGLESVFYEPVLLDLDRALGDMDLVIVHEWNDHDLVRRIGRWRARNPHARLLFHDTHHRAVTDESSMAAYDLSEYDGVLAFGKVLRDLYLARGWTGKAWTWHEAADIRVFRPLESAGKKDGGLVWVGNWGDDERTEELHEFLLNPVKKLGLRSLIHGVRYPEKALKALKKAGIKYGGWLPNHQAPRAFSRHKVTVHVPRRPYAEALPGIPTIRVFEALACGIPLVSAPWEDAENLFTPGKDFLFAKSGKQMTKRLKMLVNEPETARALVEHGLETVRARHTCAHRVDELMGVWEEIRPAVAPPAPNNGGGRGDRATQANGNGRRATNGAPSAESAPPLLGAGGTSPS